MLIVTLAVEVLPALSLTLRLTVWFVPSVDSVTLAGHVPLSPLMASEQVKLTVTEPLFQPLLFGAGLMAGVIVGDV
jgi:hypothetical protein